MNRFLCFSLLVLVVLGSPLLLSPLPELSPAAFAAEGSAGSLAEVSGESAAVHGPQARSGAHGVRLVRINCNRGQTLTRGLRHIGESLLIQFQGTCEESVLIERDDVTIRGVGENPTIVGTLTARQATRITLEDFTVRDTPNSGIEILEGTAATLRRLVVHDAGNRCINVRNSDADLSDLSTARCGSVGLVIRGSHTVLSGDIINNDSPFGLSVTEASNAFVRAGAIVANGNSSVGVLSQLSSSLSLIEGSSLVANGNGLAGISVATSAALNFFDSPIEANDNGFLGLWLQQFGEFGPFSNTSSPLQFSGNGLAGALVEKRAFLELGPDSLLTDNLFGGLLISDSSAELIDVTVKDNAVVDLSLRFDAKVTFLGDFNDIGLPLDCDDTVLVRGPFACGGALDGVPANAWQSLRPPAPPPLP